jgi:type II restriction enzyme
MDLQCNTDLASAYKAGPQIARVLSEDWCTREVYCAACDSNRLKKSRANTPSLDFVCPRCEQLYELKSLKKWNPKKIVDAGYESMMRAIRGDRTPNLLVLHYSSNWVVQNLILIPRVFFTESVIEKRKPLSLSARRAGWVGCNILLERIPEDGKIALISSGDCLPKGRVRDEFSRVRKLAEIPPQLRGWTIDVLNAIRRLGKARFSLAELYATESDLQKTHPHNRNVRPKIRQQLQVLRDLGLLRFTAPGIYELATSQQPTTESHC